MDKAKDKPPLRLSIAALILIVIVLLSGVYFARRSGTDPNRYSNDFNVYFFAARELLQGRTPYENSLGDSTTYLYPPLLAELLVPLALLPLSVAAYIWFLLSAVATFAALRMSSLLAIQSGLFDWIRLSSTAEFFPATQNLVQQNIVACLTFLMLFRFILDNFDYGQVNLIVTALAVAHIYFYTQNRKAAAAIMLALATTLKLTPAILLAYHLAKRRWHFALLTTALTIILLALSFAPFWSRAPQAFESFYKRTIKNEQGFDYAYHGNQSLRGAIERLKRVADFDLLRWEPIASGLFLLAVIVVRFRTICDLSACAPFFCLAVLLSPLSWKQHFVILMLPIAWLLGEIWREKEKRRRFVIITIVVAVFALFNLTSPKLIGIPAAEWCDAHSLVLLGALLIYFAAILRLVKSA